MPRSAIQTLAALRRELQTRDLQFVKPTVLTVGDVESGGDAQAVTPPAGSIVIYYAAAGDKLLASIQAALSAKDNKQLARLGREARKRLEAWEPRSENQILAELPEIPCLFDVRYNTKTVADHVGLLGKLRFGTVTLPYTGGRIADNGFQIAEYRKTAQTRGYQYFIAKRAPVLTRLERAALERVSAELSEIHVGSPVAEDTVKEVADVVKQMVKEAKEMKEQAKRGPRFDLLDRLDKLLEQGKVSPTATAQALIEARLELLARSMTGRS
jgi:hypothetical protein